jgi:hypothetical protein
MNDHIPHGDLTADNFCGAKTRAGSPCKRISHGRNSGSRCNLHGGKSLSGMFHPSYKHGLYSEQVFSDTRLEYEQGVRQRRQKREDNYVIPKLQAWLDSRRVLNARSISAFMAMSRNLRGEYHDRLAVQWAKYRAKVERERG